jgi:indolepyruvate ferredoxin oxidoreductase beta subunit
MRTVNVLIVGVGGQGNVVASEIVASALAAHGYRVSVGETFGASQRGGSVSSHVRAALEDVPGPLVPRGLVDVVLGFEPLETLRILTDYGRPGTHVIVNPRPVHPLAVQKGEARYPSPEELLTAIRGLAAEVLVIPATELAREAGDVRAQNIAMVGALVGSGWLPAQATAVETVLADRFTDDLLLLNLHAFRLGFEAAEGAVPAR